MRGDASTAKLDSKYGIVRTEPFPALVSSTSAIGADAVILFAAKPIAGTAPPFERFTAKRRCEPLNGSTVKVELVPASVQLPRWV